MTTFRLHDEQTVNGSRKIACAFVFHFIYIYIFTHIYIYIYIYFYIYIYLNTVYAAVLKYIYIKLQLPFVCCERKTEVCFPLQANDKR
jgi:hypothetical protein